MMINVSFLGELSLLIFFFNGNSDTSIQVRHNSTVINIVLTDSLPI